jgi:hypothetical protein
MNYAPADKTTAIIALSIARYNQKMDWWSFRLDRSFFIDLPHPTW